MAASAARPDAIDRYFPAHGLRAVLLHSDEGTLRCTSAVMDEVHLVVHGSRNGQELQLGDAALVSTRAGDTLRLTLTLRHEAARFAMFQNAVVDLTIPLERLVGAEVEDGDIEAADLDAGAWLKVRDGTIHAERVEGLVTLVTRDGSAWGRDLDGTLRLWTRDGSFDLAGRFDAVDAEAATGSMNLRAEENSRCSDAPARAAGVPGAWRLHSGGGHIRLKLPRHFDGLLTASAGTGTLDAGPYPSPAPGQPQRPQSTNGPEAPALRVLLGLQRGTVQVHSDSGTITLR